MKELNSVKKCHLRLIIFWGVVGFAILWGIRGDVFSGGYFLVPGVGLQGNLEIGGPAPPNSEIRGNNWTEVGKTGIHFKVSRHTGGVRVALIRCEQSCVTDRGIGIGSQLKEVFRRYGYPLKTRKSSKSSKMFLTYRGIGFRLENNTVDAIYIFPIFKK